MITLGEKTCGQEEIVLSATYEENLSVGTVCANEGQWNEMYVTNYEVSGSKVNRCARCPEVLERMIF